MLGAKRRPDHAQADPERLLRGSNAMTEIAAGKLSLAEIALMRVSRRSLYFARSL
jgi:hypothetical protein